MVLELFEPQSFPGKLGKVTYSDYDIVTEDFARATNIFQKMGVVIIRELAPPSLIRRVRNRMIDALRAHARYRGNVQSDGLVPVRPDNFPDLLRGIERVILAGMSDEDFERFLHGPSMMDLIANLVDGEIFVHPQKVPRVLPPGDCPSLRPAGIHQDFPELQGSGRQITVWFPLHNVDATTGVLPLYPNMHRQGVLPLTLADNPSGWAIPGLSLPQPYLASLKAGDAVVFGTYTPHGGSVNASDNLRMSIECRFQPIDDPISESAFELPGYGFGWDEVYKDWSTLGYYWHSRRPDTVEYDRQWEVWREKESIRAGRRALPEAEQALQLTMRWSRDPDMRAEAQRLLAVGPYGEGGLR